MPSAPKCTEISYLFNALVFGTAEAPSINAAVAARSHYSTVGEKLVKAEKNKSYLPVLFKKGVQN